MAVALGTPAGAGGHNTDGFDITNVDTSAATALLVLVGFLTTTTTGVTIAGTGGSVSTLGTTTTSDSGAVTAFLVTNPTQSATLTVQVRGSDASWRGAGVAIPYSGGDGTVDTWVNGATGAASTDPATGTINAGSGDFTLFFFTARNSSTTVTGQGTGQTLVLTQGNAGGVGGLILSVAEGNEATTGTDGNWTTGGGRGAWSASGFGVNASGGGGGGFQAAWAARSTITISPAMAA